MGDKHETSFANAEGFRGQAKIMSATDGAPTGRAEARAVAREAASAILSSPTFLERTEAALAEALVRKPPSWLRSWADFRPL